VKPSLSLLVLACLVSVSIAAPVPPACHAPAPDSQTLLDSRVHAPDCTDLDTTGIYPPSSGTHYNEWAKYQAYDQPVSRGYWLHSAQHGAVIILYNCPQGCASDVATLKALVNSLPVDTSCDPAFKRRVILAPDKHLDSTFAVVSWGWRMKSNCLDTAAIRAFHAAHYAHGAEDLCGDGVDYSGNRWCDEQQVGIRSIPIRSPMSSGQGLRWEGSLPRITALVLEVSSLDGARLETIPLGFAGPGPARTEWDPGQFRIRHPAAGAVSIRLKAEGKGSDGRVLAEKILLP